MTRRRNRPQRQYTEKADPNIQVVVAQQGVATPAMMPRNMRAYIQEGYRSKTVFRVVGHIARSCAGIKWKHYTDATKQKEIANSDLLALWNSPAPKTSGSQFREAMIAYYCLTGNSYILGINARQSPGSTFDELYNLRPDLTKIKVDENGPLYYEFGNFSPPRRYADPFVMHNKLFAGNDDVYGMSPVEVAAMLVDIQKAGQKWNLGLMSNMARPGGAWVTDALLGDTEYKGLKEEIRKKFAGPRNAGETAILHGGVKWQSMSMSPMELDWIESDTKSDRDIAGIFFNFPLFLLGLADSTYNNQEEARYALYTEIDLPILDMYEGSLNMWLTPRYGGGYLGYDPTDIEAIQKRLQESQGLASDRASAEFAASTITFHEAREIQGKTKLPVKDFVILNQIPVHVEDLDDYIAAMSGKTINPPPPPPQLLPSPNQTTVTEVPNDTTDVTQENTPPPAKILPFPVASVKILDLHTDAEKAAYFKTVESRRAKWEKVIGGRLQDYFRDEYKTIAAAMSRGDVSEASGNIEHALSVLEQQGTLKSLIVGIYQDVGEDFGDSVLKDLKYGDAPYEQKLFHLNLNLHAPDVLIHLLQIAGEKVKQIYSTTLTFLQDALSKGVQAGETLIQLAQRVDDLYLSEFIPDRSQTISATEVHGANEYGSSEAAKSSGLTLNKMWLSMHDSKVRPDHAEADGQEVGMDEAFDVGGESLMYPGDPAGSAGNVINCRCTVIYNSVQSLDDDVSKALTKYVEALPQLAVTREQYRELLRMKR
jgi:HK97 family phage portal protein